MKIIYNNLIPFKGYAAITICEWVFARSEYKPLSKQTINHESIHIDQCREMLYVFFYLWYVCEFLVHLIHTRGNRKQAYYMISFEKEAYANASNFAYRHSRRHYAWINYIFK